MDATTDPFGLYNAPKDQAEMLRQGALVPLREIRKKIHIYKRYLDRDGLLEVQKELDAIFMELEQ